MKRFALGILLLAFSAAISFAADLTPRGHIIEKASAPAAFTWDGAYFGLNVNAGLLETGPSITQTGSLSSLIPSNTGAHARGWLYGGQIGYNKQWGNLVAGLEATFDWGAFNSDNSSSSLVNRTIFNTLLATTASSSMNSTSLKWLSTVTPRVGFAFDRALLYVKAGLAFGKVESASAFNVTSSPAIPGGCFAISCPNSSGGQSASSVKTGWTIGSGLEVALTKNISVKGEVSYFDLGNVGGAYGTAGTPMTITYNSAVHGWLAGLGANYRF